MRSCPQYYKSKIIRRVLAALGIVAKTEPVDFDESTLESDPEFQQMAKEFDQAYEKHIAAMPRLEKKKTVFIFSVDEGPAVNRLTAHFYRRRIAKQYKRLRKLGIDTFICDSMTPLGLLAVAELFRLRKMDENIENINIYCLRYSRAEKHIRMQTKYGLKIIFLVCNCDYNYGRIYDFCELKSKILDHCCFNISNLRHGHPFRLG